MTDDISQTSWGNLGINLKIPRWQKTNHSQGIEKYPRHYLSFLATVGQSVCLQYFPFCHWTVRNSKNKGIFPLSVNPDEGGNNTSPKSRSFLHHYRTFNMCLRRPVQCQLNPLSHTHEDILRLPASWVANVDVLFSCCPIDTYPSKWFINGILNGQHSQYFIKPYCSYMIYLGVRTPRSINIYFETHSFGFDGASPQTRTSEYLSLLCEPKSLS